ncbi:unnamed protein product [Moneuplotes crassus]|uniref:Uncharacterized protein n=2 Tax=Euplotes crassus TaxID=5936 RepID=A0AAD1U447_EUPCR|nr:unnamed protein product [Moneuplotes crassus]
MESENYASLINEDNDNDKLSINSVNEFLTQKNILVEDKGSAKSNESGYKFLNSKEKLSVELGEDSEQEESLCRSDLIADMAVKQLTVPKAIMNRSKLINSPKKKTSRSKSTFYHQDVAKMLAVRKIITEAEKKLDSCQILKIIQKK